MAQSNPSRSSSKFDQLRQKAEQSLNKATGSDDDPNKSADAEEVKRLLHELQVYQTELEMQNDELKQTKEELQASEQRYAQLYEEAPVSYLTISRDAHIMDANETAAEKLGLLKADLLSRRLYDFLFEEEHDSLYLFLVRTLNSSFTQQCELRIKLPPFAGNTEKQPDSSPPFFWGSLYSKSFFSAQSDQFLCRIVFNDITQQKELEAGLVEAKQKAENDDFQKSVFLANMSHEIRTPLNGILGFTDFLRNNSPSYEAYDYYLDIIQKSGQRLLNTVNGIVEISKVRAGISTVDVEAVNLNHKLEELVVFFKSETDQKLLTITLANKLPEAEARILTDEQKLESIITNLLKNAIKYTDEGSIVVGVWLQGDTLTIGVSDTGRGIPENKQAAVFDRFNRADLQDLGVNEGAGLGLAVTASYVNMLSGAIRLSSVEGQGSTFYVDLPYRPAGKADHPSPKAQAVDPQYIAAKLANQGKTLKVIVAEDDQTSYLVLSMLLEQIGAEITHTTTGPETIDQVRANPDTDIVMMDINLPETDGYEASRQIRAFNDEVFIIAQTAYALEGDKGKALEAGVNTYVSKPIQKQALLQAINQAIPE
jgi:signal transduction histidine kinase/ActR/RegA family two-component response regulator